MNKQNRKSSVEEIRAKFDGMTERYTDLENGQDTALDSPLCMELISKAASIYNHDAKTIMDLGCGGGNYIVKLTTLLPNVNVTLVDISSNMLNVAKSRVQKMISGEVQILQSDFREAVFENNDYDIITAATTLHHLRTEEEWELVFTKIYQALKPGGSFWISDIIIDEQVEMDQFMNKGWFNWIENTHGMDKLIHTKEQFQREDTPQTLNFQLDLMKKVGFKTTHILHKHYNFAAFGAIK
jgi:tRNA (cmo5U34)-methyltransferase